MGLSRRRKDDDGQTWQEPVTTYASDLVADDEQDGDEMLDYLAATTRGSETREIEQADTRLEVERLLGPALAQLGPQRRKQVNRLIASVMDDLSYIQIGCEQGWSESTTREIVRHD